MYRIVQCIMVITVFERNKFYLSIVSEAGHRMITCIIIDRVLTFYTVSYNILYQIYLQNEYIDRFSTMLT